MKRFSKREQQIMDALHALGKATAQEVQARIEDAPSNSAIRALLAIMERKGHVKHVEDGPRYVYFPAISKDKAAKSAARHLLDVFFAGSAERAVAALLDGKKLSRAELDRLSEMIETAKREGR